MINPIAAKVAPARYIEKKPNHCTMLPQIMAPTPLLSGSAMEKVAMARPRRSGFACSMAIAKVVELDIANPTM
jgi:hypothetical protein